MSTLLAPPTPGPRACAGRQPNHFYVYRLTCHHLDSAERYYIGFRSCVGDPDADRNYWGSSRPVKEAIQCYGIDHFTKKIIATYATRAEALALEIKLHAYLDVKTHPLFFNKANQTSTKFIYGRPLTPEHRAKLIEANRRRVYTPELLAKMRDVQRGKRLSAATRAKIGAASKGRPHPVTEAMKATLRAAQTGKTHSPETKAKMSSAHRGKVVSDATRAKMAASHKARWAALRAAASGEGNSPRDARSSS